MTNHKTLSDAEMAKLNNLFAAYGADIARWPEQERKAWAEHAHLAELESERADAAVIDEMLQNVADPADDIAVMDRLNRDLLDGFDQTVSRALPSTERNFWTAIADFFSGSLLAPAGSAAVIALAGIVSGLNAPTSLSPEEEAYAYFESSNDLYTTDIEEIF